MNTLNLLQQQYDSAIQPQPNMFKIAGKCRPFIYTYIITSLYCTEGSPVCFLWSPPSIDEGEGDNVSVTYPSCIPISGFYDIFLEFLIIPTHHDMYIRIVVLVGNDIRKKT